MTQESRLRKFFVRVIVNDWFDRFIIVCILANSLCLASKEYHDKYDVSYES